MPDNSTMDTNASGYLHEHTTNGSGQYKVSFKTQNKFVDKNININITTPAASAPTVSQTGTLNMGDVSNGVYSPTVSLSGNVNVATAGWISSGNTAVNNTASVGTVPQATLTGVSSADGIQQYTITPGANAKTITIGQGYYGSNRTITVQGQSSGDAQASTPTLTLNNNATALTIGSASEGVYPATATITGAINIATAGYIDSGNTATSNSGVTVGTLTQSTISGVATSESGVMSVTPNTTTAKTVTISAGYYDADREVKVYGQLSGQKAIVTSGSAQIDTLTYTYNASSDNYSVQGSANVSAPTVSQSGYIDNSNGTKNTNTNGATVSTSLGKIGLSVGLSATSGTVGTKQPTVSKIAIDNTTYPYIHDAASGDSTTTPSTGQAASHRAYIAVQSNALTDTITATPLVTTEGYGTTTSGEYDVDSTATATIGAAASNTYYIRIKQGSVKSGSATIDTLNIAYDSNNSNFTVGGSADVSVPTYTQGYIASYIGAKTKNTGGATVDATLPKIGITGSLSYSSGSTGLKTPSISKDSNTNITGAGTATTTKPSSGYYVAVKSAKSSVNVTAVPTVTTTGYGDTTSGHYTANNSTAAEVGAAASSVTYIPLTAATFTNSATSGTTYTDISSSAPALISGDYLYINAGYTPAQKISLAKLIPDATNTNASAAYILSGYTAYDNDGALLVGTMQTYDGTYEVV